MNFELANAIHTSGNFNFKAEFEVNELASPSSFLADDSDFFIDAEIGGGNPSLGLSSVSSYSGIANSSLDLIKQKGSRVGIACSGTEEGNLDNSTCTGNESVGIVFDTRGKIRACATFNHYIYTPTTSAIVNTAFQIVKTENNSQTILEEGKAVGYSGLDNDSTEKFEGMLPLTVCGNFQANGKTTLRLMYEQNVSGAINISTILADRSPSVGQRNIHWSVVPISKQIVGTFRPAVKSVKMSGVAGAGLNGAGAIEYYGFETLEYDPDSLVTLGNAGWNGTRTNATLYTAPQDGYYRVTYSQCSNLSSLVDSNTWALSIYKNTTLVNYQRMTFEGGGGTSHQFNEVLTTDLELAEGDTIAFAGNQDSGATSTLCADSQVWATVSKIDQAGTITTSPYYKEALLDLDNNFTSGKIKIIRIGKQVTITHIGPSTHASGGSASSSDGLIPTWARPDSIVINAANITTNGPLYRIDVNENGRFRILYYDSAFAFVNQTGTSGDMSITYNLE